MSRYSKDWNKIACAIKQKADWKCSQCGADFKNKSSRGSCLQVHHWNRIPEDNRPENLVALCNICHLKYHRGGKSNILIGQLSLNL
ncbi:HNH endonuclease [Cyanobacterium aponinum UTEX 3222]|uniref:HNH endonuclease n=3 Tax=Cyanobacterium aponinum TaxID=379064 RepID=K9ZAR7_CYAAP|nr:HNH endonuclease [Cyanobacterium aponinum]WRL42434.1 HNH endonuclease [Cyanobacterium aponinum UTEX 3222]AFZ55488.1 HNH endonuclease [Cyanobacterium aponinum PCC 10605]MTF40028.1 HNH endonuclease [Cyanobacterium aponinum 0216]PHV63333.1 HNH endonuclease [Cyanobacterium aponinum IPPAS B-1201]WPF88666.1 HNH endonuclease [Cyanobacterium aponinum AL20115]